jgi:1-phosphatidylinositol-3-phosphate 5-kinase
VTLINAVSKAILQEATKADCYFLSKSNIMDYSYDYILYYTLLFFCFSHAGSFLFRLLLRIDEERKQIHRGLVDTIRSYTFVKILDYKAKGLRGKKVKISRLPLTSTKNAFNCVRFG